MKDKKFRVDLKDRNTSEGVKRSNSPRGVGLNVSVNR